MIVGRLARNAEAVDGVAGNGRLHLGRALVDESTDGVTPAGAPGGGPIVGPYVAQVSAFWRGCTDTNWLTTSNWRSTATSNCTTNAVASPPGDNPNQTATITANTNGGTGRYPSITSTANDPANSLGLLTIDAGASLSISGGAITLTGGGANNLANSGTLNVSGGTISIDDNLINVGTSTISGGTVSVGVDLTNTGTSTISGGTVSLGDDLNTNGTLNLSLGSLTVSDDFEGSGTTNMSGGSFNLDGDWDKTGNFDGTGGTVTFTGDAGGSTGFNNGTNQFFHVIVNSGVNPDFDNEAGSSILIAGNLTDNGDSVLTGSVTVTFNGTGAQSIGGSSLSAFSNLVVNKSAGSLNLLTNLTIGTSAGGAPDGTLTLQQGNLTTGGNTAIVNNGDAVARPGLTPGHVVGNLRKQIDTNASVARSFEVGTNTAYSPVNVSITGVANSSTDGTDFLTATTLDGDHTSIATSGLNASRSVNRTWTLTRSSTGGTQWTFTNYDITLNFVAGDLDVGTNTSALHVRKFNSPSTWSAPPGGSASTTTTATGNDYTTFSDYAVGELADATPPTVTINQAAGQADPTDPPINFTVVFSEAVDDFATGDVTITGTAGGT